ncbi:SbcC/MukB-like Walker B domain-containing protein, partial [Amnibacterium endophyticum]
LIARRDLLRALERAGAEAATARDDAGEAADALDRALAEAGFAGVDDLRAAALPVAEREAIETAVHRHDQARAAATAQLAEHDVAAAPTAPAEVDAAAEAKRLALEQQRAALQREADLATRAQHALALATRVAETVAATAGAREQLRVAAPLATAVRGGNARRMRLEAYVLAARLEQIVAAANLRLATMTDGRYTLRHDDALAERGAHSGLGLEVMDEHTGRTRQIASLSGGETFLASLALALGLAEVVSDEAGGVRLDTLFVDEGFGSLDRQTLDTAMETLDSLRAGGRVVGLISHVEGMQEDIPAGLHVEREADGSSSVRMRVALTAV